MDEDKRCSTCGETKSLDAFYYDRRDQRYTAECKVCRGARTGLWKRQNPDRRARHKLRQRLGGYGLTASAWLALMSAQKGCAICGVQRCTDGRSLHVDHDHGSGAVRGLLCADCNHAIGKLRDDPALLRRAALYLEEPPATTVLAHRPGWVFRPLSGFEAVPLFTEGIADD